MGTRQKVKVERKPADPLSDVRGQLDDHARRLDLHANDSADFHRRLVSVERRLAALEAPKVPWWSRLLGNGQASKAPCNGHDGVGGIQ